MLTSLVRKLMNLRNRERATHELEEEMRFHREQRLSQHHKPASRLPNAIEESRDMWGFIRLEELMLDIRYAFRRLRQHRAFSFGVITVLGLGIGTATAMFSAVDAAMLRPLPFMRPQELVTLYGPYSGAIPRFIPTRVGNT